MSSKSRRENPDSQLMKRCSVPKVTRKIQIKMLRYNFMPTIVANINILKSDNIRGWWSSVALGLLIHCWGERSLAGTHALQSNLVTSRKPRLHVCTRRPVWEWPSYYCVQKQKLRNKFNAPLQGTRDCGIFNHGKLQLLKWIHGVYTELAWRVLRNNAEKKKLQRKHTENNTVLKSTSIC